MNALTLAAGTDTRARLIALWRSHLGYAYGFVDRCGGTHHQHDCSGYICWAANLCGLAYGCTSSFEIARRCHVLGLGITLAEAQATPCALVFLGANEGQTTLGAENGADGHIAAVSERGTVLQALGRAAGVTESLFHSEPWVYAAHMPGVDFRVPYGGAPVDPTLPYIVIRPSTPLTSEAHPHLKGDRPAVFTQSGAKWGIHLTQNGVGRALAGGARGPVDVPPAWIDALILVPEQS